jgi:Protein of unknown function with PCYCGC motif
MRRTLILMLVAVAAVTTSAQWLDVPAYHSTPPTKGEALPHILGGLDLSGPSFKSPVQVRAYELAAKIPSVIYQQPCYCRCDRSVGHKSLHSCFESPHGAHCAACMRELFYSYEQHKAGKTAAQIREGIIKGEWEKLDLQAAAAAD